MVGCEDSLMPHGGLRDDLSDPRDLERHNEEVRLLYVGMTRAKQQLHLTHAQQRSLRGGVSQRFHAKISPFLQSIPGALNSGRTSSFGPPGHQTRRHIQTQPDAVDYRPNEPPDLPIHGKSTPTTLVARTPAQLRAARRRR